MRWGWRDSRGVAPGWYGPRRWRSKHAPIGITNGSVPRTGATSPTTKGRLIMDWRRSMFAPIGMTNVPSPEGAAHTSLGQRPRTIHPIGRPYRAWGDGGAPFPGPCPGLVWAAPLALKACTDWNNERFPSAYRCHIPNHKRAAHNGLAALHVRTDLHDQGFHSVHRRYLPSPEGAVHTSLGQRPRKDVHQKCEPCRGDSSYRPPLQGLG